ncbi:SWI/SNF chromatin-remodeling complex subunit [Ceratobasidium sp. 370]|nr:SWI/SNF chromatin-remodeling complex subunit [Ceratobasidium sp. 370]
MPEIFAQCLCDDLQIPSATVVQAVARLISKQLTEHQTQVVEVPSGLKCDIVHGMIGEEWWRRWRRKVAGGTVASRDEADDGLADEEDKTVSEVLVKVHLPLFDLGAIAEIGLQLDVIVGTMNLTDHFKWDINNPDNLPKEFAKVYCHDLGLGGKMAIAHSICEQASVYQKSPLLVGHLFDGTPIANDELHATMLPLIEHSFHFDRMLLEQLTPQLNTLQEGEIKRNERE